MRRWTTWVYNCTKKEWRQVFSKMSPKARRAAGAIMWLPGQKKLALAGGLKYVPKFIYFRRNWRSYSDVWTFDAKAGQWTLVSSGVGKGPKPPLSSACAAGADDVILGLSSRGRYQNTTARYWLMQVVKDGDSAAPTEGGVPPGTRSYFTAVKEYDPCWYDAAKRGDRKTVEAWMAGLPANTWVAVPKAPRQAPQRDWGTCIFDPFRDQWYHWTGGHMADPADQVSTYHPAINRWSIPYVSTYIGKGFSFSGRPDCMNHTYLNYNFDPVSKKLVCTAGAGTGVYDPDRREFDPLIPQPFRQHAYYTKTCSTPKGVVVWERGFLGMLDVANRKWVKLSVKGKLPHTVHGDECAIEYDSKRDVLWMFPAKGYRKMSGRVWCYDIKTTEIKEVEAKNKETIGRKMKNLRETVYVPDLDLVIHNGFLGEKQMAWDPGKRRWVLLNTKRAGKDKKSLGSLGGVSVGLMYDQKRSMLWAMGNARKMLAMKLDPKSIEISVPAPPAPKPVAAKK